MRKKNLWIVVVMFATWQGCYYDNEELLYPGTVIDCSTLNGNFTNVKVILAAKCATVGCHNAGSAAGGIVLETYDQAKAKADRINLRSVLEKTMPPVQALSPSEIAILKCWISSGTPNN